MAFKMRGHKLPGPYQRKKSDTYNTGDERKKFYGNRSRKDMRQDIREERKSLKDEGGTREEVKDFNANQRNRKLEIRADELDSRGRTKRADKKRSKVKKPDAPQWDAKALAARNNARNNEQISTLPNKFSSTILKKTTHTMPDGTVMPGAKHEE